jgi:hypothetical protein
LIATLQSELVGLKAETAVKVASLEDTITELAHENALLKRRLYGNKTERSHTSELQLALGDLPPARRSCRRISLRRSRRRRETPSPSPSSPRGHATGQAERASRPVRE